MDYFEITEITETRESDARPFQAVAAVDVELCDGTPLGITMLDGAVRLDGIDYAELDEDGLQALSMLLDTLRDELIARQDED